MKKQMNDTRALQALLQALAAADVVTLRGRAGSGKSAILRELQAYTGGALVNCGTSDEAFLREIEQSLAAYDVVIVDDLHRVTEACEDLRALLLDAALTAILGEASAMRKKLVFAMDGPAPWPIRRRAHEWTIDERAAAGAG